MKVLLDTNAYSALLSGDASVAARIRQAERVLVSTADGHFGQIDGLAWTNLAR